MVGDKRKKPLVDCLAQKIAKMSSHEGLQGWTRGDNRHGSKPDDVDTVGLESQLN